MLFIQDIAIVRIEQLAPFPHEAIKKAVKDYKDAEICFVQEEHENFGVWNFVYPRLKKLLNKNIKYLGLEASGSPAVGSLKLHTEQQANLLKKVFAK